MTPADKKQLLNYAEWLDDCHDYPETDAKCKSEDHVAANLIRMAVAELQVDSAREAIVTKLEDASERIAQMVNGLTAQYMQEAAKEAVKASENLTAAPAARDELHER